MPLTRSFAPIVLSGLAVIMFSAVTSLVALANPPLPVPAKPQLTGSPPASSTPDQPAYASRAERLLRETLTKHLRPLLDFRLDSEQQQALADAMKLYRAGKFDAADEFSGRVKDAAARKMLTWEKLRRGGPSDPTAYIAFLTNSSLWPGTDKIQEIFETRLLAAGGSANEIKTYFTKRQPVSGAGQAALASAELALGNVDAARRLASEAWCQERIPSKMEADFLARFDRLLKEEDHKCRLDRLLVSSPRLRFIRDSRISAAKRLLPRLSESEQKKAQVRIGLFARRGSFKALRAIVKDRTLVKEDWGLAYQRVLRSRRKKNYEHAFSILKTIPVDHPDLVNRNNWWDERQRHARYWLERGNFKRAYAIANGVRPDDVNRAKEQAFLAGWLALKKLDKSSEALDHFRRMVKFADGPLSKSMSEFWLARTYAELGDHESARRHYSESANIKDTFHALMSRREIAPKSRSIDLPPARLPTAAEIKRFLAHDAVKALLLAYAVDLPRRDVLAFYRAFGRGLESAGELALLAQMASILGDGQGEVRTGKYGVSRGFDLYEFSYPVHHLPKYEPLREPVEPSLVFAIGRQESEFNTKIVSRAGARGVLQVMPITARHICRQYGIRCNLADLLSVPSYNARIASAYIADRRDEFGGSYILTLTGFNAGPGRTRQWLRKFADPRDNAVDPFEWIYGIPFEETRLYVRKVLSNVQIYRARLGENDPLQIDLDLNRGRR
jgi:soluble lytic murein transglycosylase